MSTGCVDSLCRDGGRRNGSVEMTTYGTADIRNLALTGPSGAGKTTLVEQLLVRSGVIPSAGTIEKGDTICDHDPLERELGRSVDSSLVHFDFAGAHINLIDTPGNAEFLGKSISVLPAVETVVVVIDADNGIDTVVRRIMRIAAERNLPRMIVINKIDHGGDLEDLLASIQEMFGNVCQPINLPANGGTEVIDCFGRNDGESDLGPVSMFHDRIVDQVVEVDEGLMAGYLETGEVSPEALHAPFEKALREAHLIPIFFTAAASGTGVPEFLDAIVRLCPSPMEGNPRAFRYEKEGVEEEMLPSMDCDDHLLAHVFKVSSDPYVGKLCVFKVHQGTLAAASQPKADDGRKPIRVAHVFKIQGDKHSGTDRMVAGDIGAVAKIEHLHYNSVLHDGSIGDHIHLRPLPLPRPMFGVAIEAANRNAEAKLGEAMRKLLEEDPTLVLEQVAATHQTVLRGLGDMHVKTKIRILKDRYGVDVVMEPPKVSYKETVTTRAEGHHRHKKQSGGSGQFGEVFLRVEPLAPSEEIPPPYFQFVDETVGGSVPKQFMPAIEKGIRNVLDHGAIAGYPMQGIRVIVYDGKFHPVDSKEIAFMKAGSKAFVDAVAKARPSLLEPVVSLEISVGAELIGDIASDISGKRGRINGTDMVAGGLAVIHAEAPLSEVMNYANQLKSITGGAGSFHMEYSHDEPTPAAVQSAVVASFKPSHGED